MQLWKLGCRWRKGTPLFYDFIKDESIVIGWIDKDYAVGDWLLITDGHTVLSLAQILQRRERVFDFPQYESIFDELKIPYNENLFIYRAKHIQLKPGDQFTYPLQQGIVKVHKPEYIAKFNHLKQKYIIPNMDIIEILINKKQIILQGAPGTGKTYIAKDIAEQLIFDKVSDDKKLQAERLKASEQFKLVQFHPSYTYEDFVRGIEVKTESGQPEYIVRNRVLGEFSEEARENWHRYNLQKEDKAKETIKKESKFEQFIDSIQQEIDKKGKYQLTDNIYLFEYDDTRFKYKGDNWEAHFSGLNMKYSELKKVLDTGLTVRAEIKKISNTQKLTVSHATYYTKMAENYAKFKATAVPSPTSITLKNYVLIIDEMNRANLPSVFGELIYSLEYRGEEVESMYALDGDNGLIIPPNLYIIGTMNTADRSVGQIDYAIRRRFAFVDMLPKVLTDPGFDVDLFKAVSAFFIKNVDDYINNPDNTSLEKSEFLSDEYLPEDVWIGHSYFIMDDHNRDIRLNYEIKPLLREYLKDGILKDSVEGEKTKVLINNL